MPIITSHSSNIKDAINKLKRGKNDGYDGLTSDYIINGTPLLFHYLSILFFLMLSHCYAPSSFCISTMVPIPKKSSGSMGEITNYRGIALSSLLSKIFDNCIISNQMTVCLLMIYNLHINQKLLQFIV